MVKIILTKYCQPRTIEDIGRKAFPNIPIDVPERIVHSLLAQGFELVKEDAPAEVQEVTEIVEESPKKKRKA